MSSRSAPSSISIITASRRHSRCERLCRQKHVMLIGVTGFIGKVWLANTLMDLPEIGRIYLLIRRQKSNPAIKRFEKMVEESPVFDPLYEKYGMAWRRFISDRVEVVEGDVTRSGLGLTSEIAKRLQADLDLIVNSSGLTDFNPDLRDALATNVDAAVNILEFVRESDMPVCCIFPHVTSRARATAGSVRNCGQTTLPRASQSFDAEEEWQHCTTLVKEAEAESESPEVTAELRPQAQGKEHAAKDLQGAGARKSNSQEPDSLAQELPHRSRDEARQRTGLAQYLHSDQEPGRVADREIRGAGLPIGGRASGNRRNLGRRNLFWDGTKESIPRLRFHICWELTFRQLPSNESKRLDIIPVDSVCQGMTLIAAAVIERRHDPVYQLATSVTNPCDMGRSIELTSLAHRKHYRAQEGLESWLRLRFDAIPVSKTRYNRMSAPAQKAIVKSIQRIMAPLPLKKTPLAKAERNLERVEKLIELFEPFILHERARFRRGQCRETFACAGAGRARRIRLRHALAGLVGVLDQHSYSRAAALDLSLIEGRPLEARPPRSFSSQRMSADERRNRENRNQRSNVAIFLTDRQDTSARMSPPTSERPWRGAERAGAGKRRAGSRSPPVAGAAVASCDFPRFYEHLQTRIRIFPRRSHDLPVSD